MRVFKWKNNKSILIRNHELSPGAINNRPFGKNDELLSKVNKNDIYDFGKAESLCYGGTSTLVQDEKLQKVELEYLSLIVTVRNCAGGITPWNCWITCEESTLLKGGEKVNLEQNHGYNFEIFASDNLG